MTLFEDRCGTPGKDYGLGSQGPQFRCREIMRDDLAVYPAFADAAGDELGVLGTEIEDCYEFTHV
jgi:hypothetical protein